MRILVLTSSYPVPDSPLGPFIEYLNRALAEQGMEIRVLIFSARGRFDRKHRGNIEVIEYPYSWILPPRLHAGRALLNSLEKSSLAKLEFPFYLAATAWYLLRFARDCDVIHAHWYLPAGLMATLTRPLHRKPVVVTAWGKEFHLPEGPFFKGLLGFVHERCAFRTTVSEYMRRRASRYGINPESCMVVTNGVVPGDFKTSGHRTNGKPLIVGYVSRLVREKRAQDAIETFAVILKRMPERPTKLWIVGGGPEYERLTDLVRSLGIQDHVVFHGYLESSKIPGILASIDIFFNPSQEEGMATNNIEAMAAGVPVIATEGVGNDEVVVNGETGLLYPVGDIGKASGALERLIRNPGIRQQMSRKAIERVRNQFDIRTSAAAYIRLYRQAVLSPSGPSVYPS